MANRDAGITEEMEMWATKAAAWALNYDELWQTDQERFEEAFPLCPEDLGEHYRSPGVVQYNPINEIYTFAENLAQLIIAAHDIAAGELQVTERTMKSVESVENGEARICLSKEELLQAAVEAESLTGVHEHVLHVMAHVLQRRTPDGITKYVPHNRVWGMWNVELHETFPFEEVATQLMRARVRREWGITC